MMLVPGSNTPFCQVWWLFYFCVIGCADHCVYEALVPSTVYLGGRVVVGSEFYEIFASYA